MSHPSYRDIEVSESSFDHLRNVVTTHLDTVNHTSVSTTTFFIMMLIAGAFSLTRAYIPFAYPATMVHELAHAIVTKACGGSVAGIRLAFDTSGTTHVATRRPRMLALPSLLAGYPAPAALAWAMTWASAHHHMAWVWLGNIAVCLIASYLARGVLARLIAAVGLLASLIAFTVLPVTLSALAGAWCAYLMVMSVRALANLVGAWQRDPHAPSDASMAAGAVYHLIPTFVWVGAFAVAVLALCGLTVSDLA